MLILFCVAFITACDQPDSMTLNQLPIPERSETAYITDQVYVAGNSLSLWTEESGCQLRVAQEGKQQEEGKQLLKPTAPCYFVKSPGSQKVQVFQQDKTTRIVAVLGSALQENTAKRCGSEIQGLIINRHGHVRLSDRILKGSVYCAESGLDNFQYSLFHGS